MKYQLNYERLVVKKNSGLQKMFYGGEQDWYSSHLKRIAGCGPTTATTITIYEQRKKNPSKQYYLKEEYVTIQEELWNYITPGMMGVNKLEMYISGYDHYIQTHDLGLQTHQVLEISEQKEKRPTKEEVFQFLSGAIKKDHPIAFLNLHHGREVRLESWHWVTIVGICYQNDRLMATMADDGRLTEIDLGLWLETTNNRGGFIYYE